MSVGRGVNLKDESEVTSNSDKIGFHILDNLENYVDAALSVSRHIYQSIASLQVKEYLENLGTEYRFSCYYEKEPKGCHLLADYMDAIKKDSHTAFEVYLKNCDERSHPHSCHKVAGFRVVQRSERLKCNDMLGSKLIFRH